MLDLPTHVGIIMDGNGRWGESRSGSRTIGHIAGAGRAEEIVLHAKKIGIKYVTLFAFSTENWNRPGYEVSVIKRLGIKFMHRRLRGIDQEAIGVRIIGRREDFDTTTQRLMMQVEENTKHHTDFILQVALSYGGRAEIARAMNQIHKKIRSGDLPDQELTPDLIEAHLYTAGIPDPDLIIRTSGEMRTSNFLPWQSVYSEWSFRRELWPDFTPQCFDECIDEYKNRERRMGSVPMVKVG